MPDLKKYDPDGPGCPTGNAMHALGASNYPHSSRRGGCTSDPGEKVTCIELNVTWDDTVPTQVDAC